MSVIPKGKGFYIWKVRNCEGGDNAKIATTAYRAGLKHVLIKIANGIYDYNYDTSKKRDLVAPLAEELLKRDIQVWGWHYVFGDSPKGEAKAAIRQIQKMPLTGYVIDAEAEYKGKYTPCRIFMNEIRSALPDIPIALSSYRYPKYHNDLPWEDFLSKSQFNMPQVYWEQSRNPGEQLAKCLNQFETLVTPVRPIIPTGSAYGANAWYPRPEEITEFMQKAVDLKMPGVNFWSWDYCRKSLPHLWETIATFKWPEFPNPTVDIAETLIQAINARDIETLVNCYTPDAIHITAERTLQGHAAIRDWYNQLMLTRLKNARLEIIKFSGSDPTRYYSWKITLTNTKSQQGSDTIGISNQKIIYHYSSLGE